MKNLFKHEMNQYRVNPSHKCHHKPVCGACMSELAVEHDKDGRAVKVVCVKCGDKLEAKC